MKKTENKIEKENIVYEEAFSSFTKRSIRRLKKEPHIFVPGFIAYIKGLYYKIKFRLSFKKISIGRHFRVYGKLIISGPGSVEFGDDCFIMSNVIKTVAIKTLHPKGKVILGDHVGLNGTSIVCKQQVHIDNYSNIADAYITDTAAHPISIDRRLYSASDVPGENVYIGKNVWISVHTVILKGVHIGENSVIGACSLVRKNLPSNVLAAGIPAEVIKELPTAFTSER